MSICKRFKLDPDIKPYTKTTVKRIYMLNLNPRFMNPLEKYIKVNSLILFLVTLFLDTPKAHGIKAKTNKTISN